MCLYFVKLFSLKFYQQNTIAAKSLIYIPDNNRTHHNDDVSFQLSAETLNVYD